MPRPISAELSSLNLKHNIAQVRQHAPRAKILAAVKANAYGHGLHRLYPALADCIDGFAILNIEDGLLLRESGWQGTIILLEGCFSKEEMQLAAAHHIGFSIHQMQHLTWLKDFPDAHFHVFLKINTGMNRLGFPVEQVKTVYDTLQTLAQISEITLMTHFANADAASHSTTVLHASKQLDIFKEATKGLAGSISVSNSAAILQGIYTEDHWVRPGIMIYGASPFAWKNAKQCNLKPVMMLKSEVIAIQHLDPGSVIGYGSRYTAHRTMRIGVVACGYGDGYPRHAPDGTPVLVNGQRTQLIGRVSMDMITIDLTHHPNAQIGSVVELWGQNLAIEEVAQAAGTISYELLCALTPRVPVTMID